MRSYEAVMVLAPTLDESGVAAFIEQAQKAIADKGGEVRAVDRWGRRQLAYEVKKHREGHFILFRFNAEQRGGTDELQHICRINDNVLRHLIVCEQEGAHASPKTEASEGAAASPEKQDAAAQPERQEPLGEAPAEAPAEAPV